MHTSRLPNCLTKIYHIDPIPFQISTLQGHLLHQSKELVDKTEVDVLDLRYGKHKCHMTCHKAGGAVPAQLGLKAGA